MAMKKMEKKVPQFNSKNLPPQRKVTVEQEAVAVASLAAVSVETKGLNLDFYSQISRCAYLVCAQPHRNFVFNIFFRTHP